MARHDASWWAERVAEFERTGDAERIARTYRVTVERLKWWRWRLRSGEPRIPSTAVARAGEPRLLPVVVTGAADASDDDRETHPATIIETSRGRISIRGLLSPEQLANVVAELVRGC